MLHLQPSCAAPILRLGKANAQMRVQKLTFIAPHEISGRSQQSQLLTHDLRGAEKLVDAQTEAERGRGVVRLGRRPRPDFGRLENHVQFEDSSNSASQSTNTFSSRPQFPNVAWAFPPGRRTRGRTARLLAVSGKLSRNKNDEQRGTLPGRCRRRRWHRPRTFHLL